MKRHTLRCDLRILKSIQRVGLKTALLMEEPPDCFLSQNGQDGDPSYTVITENNQGLFLARNVTDRKFGEQLLESIANGRIEGDQLLRLPIRAGDRVGQDPPRHDDYYCWLVSRQLDTPDGTAWEVTYFTLPHEERFEIVPGIGITGYHYRHHGTIMETNLRLVAYDEEPETVPEASRSQLEGAPTAKP